MKESEAQFEGKDKPLVIPWRERDLRWRVAAPPFSDKPGWYGATIGPAINGASVRFFPYYLPFGQARPFHIGDNIELIIFMLEGEIEFGVGPKPDDLQYIRVAQYDTLFVPLGLGVDYRNVGQTDARYVMTIGQVGGEWPDEIIYHLPGNDEPFARSFK